MCLRFEKTFERAMAADKVFWIVPPMQSVLQLRKGGGFRGYTAAIAVISTASKPSVKGVVWRVTARVVPKITGKKRVL